MRLEPGNETGLGMSLEMRLEPGNEATRRCLASLGEPERAGFVTVCCQSGQLLWLHMHGLRTFTPNS